MRQFILSIAEGTRLQASNKVYSVQVDVDSTEALRNAVQYDHVAGMFRNNERSNDNFISTDCVMMDCDNEHTENSAEWLTPEALAARLPDVEFDIVYSKSHLKPKDASSPRPRWHVYFPLSETANSAKSIRVLKEQLLRLVPEFDAAAKDAARFFYGVPSPVVELHEGGLCIDEFLTMYSNDIPESDSDDSDGLDDDDDDDAQTRSAEDDTGDAVINAGNRHNTLLRVALDALSRYSESKAREIFDNACARCKPPKPIAETLRIWDWATDKVREIKAKQRKVLTLPIVEQTLAELGISVSYNVITKDIEVSGLPLNSEFVHASYYSLDQMTQMKVAPSILPAFLYSYFKAKNYGVSSLFVTDAISALASTHPRNPVGDMLNSTVWDGQERIGALMVALGILDNGDHCAFLRKWLHQAIALALNSDGAISPEFALVLQGAQGVGKTNFFRRLAVRPEWFKEGAVIDMRDKDSRIESTSVWICELGELDSTLKREQASLKAFLTSNFDTYRKPYARKAEKVERRTCFCATVNPEAVNRDTTGSRRFVYIHVDAIDKHFVYDVMTPVWCAQLWRQVYEEIYQVKGRAGFYLTDEQLAYIAKANEEFSVPLPAETELLDLLDWESNPLEWEYRSATQILRDCGLHRNYPANKAGEALTRLCARFYGADKKRAKGRSTYRVPKPRNPINPLN
mgnify:CR=1 FL=1